MRILALVALLVAVALAVETTRQKRQLIYTTGFGFPSASLNYGYTGYTGLSNPTYSFSTYPNYGLTYGFPSAYSYNYPYGNIVIGK